MCCGRLILKTREYRRRKGWFWGWKVYRAAWLGSSLMSISHECQKGGKVSGPGRITSDRDTPRSYPDNLTHKPVIVRAGIHVFLDKARAWAFASACLCTSGERRFVVRVMVRPKDVVAVGGVYYESEDDPTRPDYPRHRPFLLYNNQTGLDEPIKCLVAKSVKITKREWNSKELI